MFPGPPSPAESLILPSASSTCRKTEWSVINLDGAFCGLDGEGDVVEAPDGVLGRDGATGPSGTPVFGGDELDAEAVGVLEGEDRIPEAVARFLEADALSTRRSVQ